MKNKKKKFKNLTLLLLNYIKYFSCNIIINYFIF